MVSSLTGGFGSGCCKRCLPWRSEISHCYFSIWERKLEGWADYWDIKKKSHNVWFSSLLAGQGRKYCSLRAQKIDALESSGFSFKKVSEGVLQCRSQAAKSIRSRECARCGWERILQQRGGGEDQTRLHKGKRSDHDFIQHLIFIQESVRKTRQLTFSWLTYTSYKKSQEILRAWEWHPVIISYTR